MNLLAATRSASPRARFVLTSTSNVYADDLERPAREEDRTTTATAYAASKLAAESALRDSGLLGSVLRFPFVYGDGDGHLESSAPLLADLGAHPAQRFSAPHHQDLAAAVRLALAGVTDGRTVNVAGDAPVSVLEMAQIGGADYPPSAAPLAQPWRGQVDTTLARSLGFAPEVPTVQQAAREDKL